MHWLLAHVYVTGIVIAGIVLLGGGLLVSGRAPLSITDSESTWGGAGGASLFSGISGRREPASEARVRTQDLLKGQGETKTSYTILPVNTGVQIEEKAGAGEFSWESLIAQLAKPAPGAQGGTKNDIAGFYSFIPSGLISTNGADVEFSEEQQALFDYGNNVGSYIRGFDDAHKNMIQILKDAYEDRGNSVKAEAAMQIGRDYIQLGTDLEGIDALPPAAAGMHLALVKAYKESGAQMINKMKTTNDKDFLTAVYAYNASVEQFQKSYIALVNLFAVAEVTFSQTDPGSVFMFQSSLTF